MLSVKQKAEARSLALQIGNSVYNGKQSDTLRDRAEVWIWENAERIGELLEIASRKNPVSIEIHKMEMPGRPEYKADIFLIDADHHGLAPSPSEALLNAALHWDAIDKGKEIPAVALNRPLPDHDNHHNALVCPYCNPENLILVPRGEKSNG